MPKVDKGCSLRAKRQILLSFVMIATGLFFARFVLAGVAPDCQTVPTVISRIEHAHLVIIGHADQGTVEMKGTDQLQTWFVVEKVLKGSVSQERILVTDCSHWKCEGRRMKQGEKYVLLLMRDVGQKEAFALHPLGCRVKAMLPGSLLLTKSAIPYDEEDRMVSEILWATAVVKRTYADGSGNLYRLHPNTIEYIPVEPAMSSSGTYSGGQYATKSITSDQFQKVTELFVQALADDKAKIQNRIKGSVLLEMEKDQKKTRGIFSHGKALQKLEEYLKGLMVGEKR